MCNVSSLLGTYRWYYLPSPLEGALLGILLLLTRLTLTATSEVGAIMTYLQMRKAGLRNMK